MKKCPSKFQYIYKGSIYLLKYYFKSQLIQKLHYYRQTIFNQLNIMVPYVDIIGLCHSVAILQEIYVMQHKYHVRWHNFHFKRNANYETWSIFNLFTLHSKPWISILMINVSLSGKTSKLFNINYQQKFEIQWRYFELIYWFWFKKNSNVSWN